jgi:hypothetical protein
VCVSKLVRSVELGRGVSLLRYPPSVAMIFAECLYDTAKRSKIGLWYDISMERKSRSTSKLPVGVLRWIRLKLFRWSLRVPVLDFLEELLYIGARPN